MINKLTIIGLGLMGASIALNAKKNKAVKTIVGFDLDHDALVTAKNRHFIDKAETNLALAVYETDLVIIAVPVAKISTLLQELALVISEKTIVTDVGSTKQSVMDDVETYFKKYTSHFVPGHPITGSEQRGGQHAIEDLFQGSKVVLTPIEKTEHDAVKTVTAFWQRLGASVEILSAKEHDLILALTSHLPHLIAMAFMNSNNDETIHYTGGGFKKMTRIAKANPDMWADIYQANRNAIIEQLTQFRQQLDAFEAAIASNDKEQIKQLVEKSKTLREKID